MKKSELRRIIREIIIKELNFTSQDAFNSYNKQHKLRQDTKVNIAGKQTTAGKASGDKKTSKVNFELDNRGIPGGSIKQIEKKYNLKVTRSKYNDNELEITGSDEDLNNYLEDYALTHLKTK